MKETLEGRNLYSGRLIVPPSSISSRSQLKAKFFDFLDENRLIFAVLSGCFQRLDGDFSVLLGTQEQYSPCGFSFFLCNIRPMIALESIT